METDVNYSAYTHSLKIDSGSFFKHIKDIIGWKQQFVFAPVENISWREEFISSIKILRNTYDNLNIMFSGGGDSLMTSLAFIEAGITDVHHTVWVFTDNGEVMHPRELNMGYKHLHRHNLKYTVQTVEINTFFDVWCNNPEYGKYTCLELDRALQLYMLAHTDSSWFNMINEPTPSLTMRDGKRYLRNTFDQMLHMEFMKEFNIQGISRVYTHTPALTTAWFHGTEMQDVMYKDSIEYSKAPSEMATGWNQYKYTLYEKMYGFNVCEYYIDKSTIQMWDNKKYLAKWHQLMDEGILLKRSTNLKMEIPYELLHQSWVNETNEWFDYKDHAVSTIDGPWHTAMGIEYGKSPFRGQNVI
jgi:hypothetical protein